MKNQLVEFDRGTTVIRSGESISKLPEAKHDARVAATRLPGRSYHQVLGRLGMQPEPAPTLTDLNQPDISLAPHQSLALNAWMQADKTGLISLPTGAGKTHIALKAIALCRVRTLVLVPTIILMEQWFVRLQQCFGTRVSRFGDGHHDILDLCVATFESAYRHSKRMWSQFDLLIVDEAHHFCDGMRDEFLDLSCARFRMGLSATLPADVDKLQGLIKRIGPVVFEASLVDLVGVALSKFMMHRSVVSLPPWDFSKYKDYANRVLAARKALGGKNYAEFTKIAVQSTSGREAIVYAQLAKRIITAHDCKLQVIANLLKIHATDRILIFTYDSADALKVAGWFKIPVIIAATSKKEREWVLGHFREGSLPALVTCKVLNEGYDLPEANVAIFVSGFCAKRDFIQRMGRVLRPKECGIAHIYEILARGTQEEKASFMRAHSLRLGKYYAKRT